jgi:hypothetical protein
MQLTTSGITSTGHKFTIGRDCKSTKSHWAIAIPLEFKLRHYKLTELEGLAIKKYQELTGTYSEAYPLQLLERLTVNYLKHEGCNYDDILDTTRDVSDTWTYTGYLILRLRVLKEIAKAFPELGKECVRQWKKSTGMSWYITYDKLISEIK